MATASWNGTVIAESDDTVVVEGNHYFPIGSVIDGALEPSDHTTVCSWKGTAAYYDVVVDGDRNANAAFWYPTPNDAAAQITDRVAFWRGVDVVAEDPASHGATGRPGERTGRTGPAAR